MEREDRSGSKAPLEVMMPRHLGITMAVGILLFILLLFAITSFQLRDSITVTGRLEPSSGLTQVYARSSGEVVRAAAQPGQKVEKGQLLYLLKTSQSSVTNRDVQTSILKKLEAKKNLLEDKLSVLRSREKLEKGSLYKRTMRLKKQIALLQKQKMVLERESEKLNSLYKKEQRMAQKHLITSVQLASAMIQYNSSQVSLLQISSNLNEQKNQLERDKDLLKINLSQLRSDILDVESALTDVSREKYKISAMGTEAVYSPVNGTVSYLPLHDGQAAAENQLVATIVPHASKLVARVYLPSSAMGKVQVGDKVKIRYSSFPYLQYGLFSGEVSYVALTPSQDRLQGGENVGQGYMATIKLTDARKLHLLPGAKLKATIVTGHASLLLMIFAPVLRIKSAIDS